MLKFLVSGKDGRKMLGIGLTEGNVKRLREGQPISFPLKAVWPEAAENDTVLVYWGEDMVDLKKQLVEQMGIKLPPETEE